MRKLKLIILALALVLLPLSDMQVRASETSFGDNSIPSTFSIEYPTIGGNLTVTVPTSIQLEYSEVNNSMMCKDVLSANGTVDTFIGVSVSLPKTGQLTSTSGETVDCNFVLGEKDNTVSWSSYQLNATDATEHSLHAYAMPSSFETSDAFTGTVEFEIDTDIMGLTRNLCVPTLSDKFTRISGISYTYYDIANMAGDIQLVNLSNILSYTNKTTYYKFTSDQVYSGSEAEKIKAIQLASSDNLYYTTFARETSSTHKYSYTMSDWWLKNTPNVELLVIPENCKNIMNVDSYDSEDFPVKLDVTDRLIFSDSEETFGNALPFMISYDDTAGFYYVPHIVYQGSMDSWRALSGYDDWTFSAMANDYVTVHCTDGNIFYQ